MKKHEFLLPARHINWLIGDNFITDEYQFKMHKKGLLEGILRKSVEVIDMYAIIPLGMLLVHRVSIKEVEFISLKEDPDTLLVCIGAPKYLNTDTEALQYIASYAHNPDTGLIENIVAELCKEFATKPSIGELHANRT